MRGQTRIIVNRARCLICGDVVESRSLNDVQTCRCLNKVTVSGGHDIIQHSAENPCFYVDLSMIRTDEGTETRRGVTTWRYVGEDDGSKD